MRGALVANGTYQLHFKSEINKIIDLKANYKTTYTKITSKTLNCD